jgi:hypothetical protein
MPEPSPMEPHILRTPFTPADLPDRVTLWYCPACGKRINGSYNLEPARKSCTKTWHLAQPVAVKYARELPKAQHGQEDTNAEPEAT